jgi:prohibitin 1
MQPRLARLLSTAGAVLFAGGLISSQVLYNVPAGHRGILYDRTKGVLPESTTEGTHFKLPIIQRATLMDTRTTPRSISTVTGTKDLQVVNLSLRVLYRPVEDQITQIFKEYGTDYADRILPSIGNEVLKSVVAQYNAEELLTRREAVSQEITSVLLERCRNFGIRLDDVSLTHLSFSPEFAKSIEDKQVAEQRAERAKFVVMKSEQERQANIIRAEGDAQAAMLISDAMAKYGRGMLEVRRIEAAQEIASNISNSKTARVTYLPSSSNMLIQPK